MGVTGAVDWPGMAWSEVRAVLHALSGLGCRFWLEGGWGVDALIGHQTRAHRDVDIDDACAEAALRVLGDLGYVIESDWRPNRVELVAPERGWVDLHPLLMDQDGSARQAALGGDYHTFPPSFFTFGSVHGTRVPCASIEAQRLFRTGYEPRDVDVHDLAQLAGLSTSPAAGSGAQPSR
jgi:lincosamide nucleotidyltransferase A/C/D/E